MLISERYRVIFVHVQKTGGMSIEGWLRLQDSAARFHKHRHLLARMGAPEINDWDSYFSFGFVRNPWDRLVSWWAMIQENPTAYPDLPFWQYVRKRGPTFEDFILHCTDTIQDSGTIKSAALPQLDYLSAASGQQIVQYIGRFETLVESVREVQLRANLPGAPLAHLNATRHPKQYRDYYTAQTRQLVAERFAIDIERFGYSF